VPVSGPVSADRDVVTVCEGFVVPCDRGTIVDEDALEEEPEVDVVDEADVGDEAEVGDEVDVGDEVEVDAVLMREVLIVGIFTDERLTCNG
jgi:hypothetical protein